MQRYLSPLFTVAVAVSLAAGPASAGTTGFDDGGDAGRIMPTGISLPRNATVMVNNGDNLQQAINQANAGDTLLVAPGTYTANGVPNNQTNGQHVFHVWKALTIRSTGGPGATVLTRTVDGNDYTVRIRASGVTIEGFTITGSNNPVITLETGGGAMNNVQLRNLWLTPTNNAPGHGIYFVKTSSSLIEGCTIGTAPTNGIFISDNSNDNLVVFNTVVGTRSDALGGQHGIAIQDSHRNRLFRNTVNGGFHAILLTKAGAGLPGADYNRVEWNTVAGQRHDGITVDAGSEFNTIAYNLIDGQGHPFPGTGLWLNSESNGNYAFENVVKNSPEAGVSIFKSSKNYVEANEVSGNAQAGILEWNQPDPVFSVGNRPQFNYLHNNYAHDNPVNGNVALRDVADADVAYNYLSGVATGNPDTGINFDTVDRAAFYGNTLRELSESELIKANCTGLRLFRNRHLNEGIKHCFQGAGAIWDASVFIGGNFWSGQPAAGNPSRTTPFTDFVIDNGGTRGGGYIDAFPFQNATFGRAPALVVREPVAGQIVATGQTKTLRWESRACTFVKIEVGAGGSFSTLQASWPDVGYYAMALSTALPAGSNYNVRLSCLNQNGAQIGGAVTSPDFTVSNDRVYTLAPGRDEKVAAGSTYRFSWLKSAAVANVDVQVSIDGGAFANLQTNLPGSFADLAVPNVSSNNVRIRVKETGGSGDDSTDGTFTIAGGVTAFTDPTPGAAQLIGDPIRVAWLSPPGSVFVDLSFYDGVTFRAIATGLADVGHFTWFVPEYWASGSKLRATFKNAAGGTISTLTGNDFNLRYGLPDGTGVAINRYRLYNDLTFEHLFTTDLNEYTVLPQISSHWIQEGVSHRLFTGPAVANGVPAAPLYRLYFTDTTRHLWTTDRNEYFTLRPFTNWVEEHVDGYIFPVQVPGTVPLYRLRFSLGAPLHHWTTDQNEYNVLPSRGWIQEGAIGFVLP